MPGATRFVRMSGSSIAAPSAAGWVTDFLNAAYFARPAQVRSPGDLRLAFAVLTTRWAQGDGRLGARDMLAFHRVFGSRRLRAHPRGTLDRDALLAGGCELLGDWFASAVEDPERRAHGAAFRTLTEREAFEPERRLAHAALGPLVPPRTPPRAQAWSTYPPVPLASATRTAELMAQPGRWPDAGVPPGRFTALRSGGLHDQTFEIEVTALPTGRTPVSTRAYVTATTVLHRGEHGIQRFLDGLAAETPRHEDVHLAIELTTHEGHFLGRARSRLLVYEDADGAWLRAIGSWDPLPPYLAAPFALAGRAAQRAFWGPEDPDASMLAQLARLSA